MKPGRHHYPCPNFIKLGNRAVEIFKDHPANINILNRNVLIISPYFPPVNAADMQRVRMSLSYFKQYGWDAEVVTVDPRYSELVKKMTCS